MTRIRKNKSELHLETLCKRLNIEHSKRGYPDFTIYKDGEIFGFIEVKPNHGKELKREQKSFERFCKRMKIPFMKWTPEDGEEAILKLWTQ